MTTTKSPTSLEIDRRQQELERRIRELQKKILEVRIRNDHAFYTEVKEKNRRV